MHQNSKDNNIKYDESHIYMNYTCLLIYYLFIYSFIFLFNSSLTYLFVIFSIPSLYQVIYLISYELINLLK